MSTIYFVTGNNGKFKEVQAFFKRNPLGASIEQKRLDVPEIQSLDLEKVATEKARTAWNMIKQPLLIDDGGIFLEDYNLFPGTLSKYVMKGLGIQGFLTLALEKPKASFRTCIVYINAPDSIHIFQGVCMGTVVEPRPNSFDDELPYRSLFKPDGYDVTYDQLSIETQEKIHHRTQALQAFHAWYTSK